MSTTFRSFTDIFFHEGTGAIHLEHQNTLLSQSPARATSALVEAPESAVSVDSLSMEKDKLVPVTAAEHSTPHGTTLFVLGKL
ncbi:hypothetical protein NET03_06380 [Thermomicrobium sp. CFH 73360]|uniref:hypothetical protein n=1 Tax=Thermomicrobium sp. CFH 73360 TaxID=2951987 RepID=UPI0020771A2F|nr:hypothetical protein [Thermomicrobium sp. CFH 73360]MCM8746153.1 hypothetical protein [Thermomicrobium sp. CFH 73360]